MRPFLRSSFLVLLALAVASCATSTVSEPAVHLELQGSSSVTPLAMHFAQSYANVAPDSVITVTQTDSGDGVTSAGEGIADIGMASRPLKDAEKAMYPELREFVIARDAIVVIIHPSRTLASLTTTQLAGIFAGTITDWSAVGQPAGPITVFAREVGSGTRDFFKSTILGSTAFGASVMDRVENAGVIGAVAADPTSIGFTSLGAVNDTVRYISVDAGRGAVEPTEDAVRAGTYLIARPLSFLTVGDPAGDALAFFEFCLRPASQASARDLGFVPLF